MSAEAPGPKIPPVQIDPEPSRLDSEWQYSPCLLVTTQSRGYPKLFMV